MLVSDLFYLLKHFFITPGQLYSSTRDQTWKAISDNWSSVKSNQPANWWKQTTEWQTLPVGDYHLRTRTEERRSRRTTGTSHDLLVQRNPHRVWNHQVRRFRPLERIHPSRPKHFHQQVCDIQVPILHTSCSSSVCCYYEQVWPWGLECERLLAECCVCHNQRLHYEGTHTRKSE